jgi:hypothetical protein
MIKPDTFLKSTKKRKRLLLIIPFVIVLLVVLVLLFGETLGFPKNWAIDCGCFGFKRYFVDLNNITRCSCYGITTWWWLE